MFRLVEVKEMADRIINMRSALYDILVKELGSKKDWSHIKNQIGTQLQIPFSSSSICIADNDFVMINRNVLLHRTHT